MACARASRPTIGCGGGAPDAGHLHALTGAGRGELIDAVQTVFWVAAPIAAAALLIVYVTGLQDRWTAIGALVWLFARIFYLPVYALGIPMVRTLIFLVSIVGIALILRPAIQATFT